MLATLAVASALSSAPIVGGTATAVGDFPNVVAILVGSGICTGELVAPTWVLTAAHCVDPGVVHLADHAAVVASIRVLVGTVDATRSGGSRVGAKAAYSAPGWDAAVFGAHDLALIELASPVDGVAPAVVNLDPARAPIGTTVTMVGFGAITSGANPGKEFVVLDRTSGPCATVAAASGLTLDDARVTCYAQTDGKGKCDGDSGGPSFALIDGVPQIVGITDFGDPSCAIYGVDTRPDAEADFLLSHVDLCAAGADCTGRAAGCCAVGGDGTGAVAIAIAISAGARRRRARRTADARGCRRGSSRAG